MMSELFKKIGAIQAEGFGIQKGTQGFGYKYPNLEGILRVLNPFLAAHSLFVYHDIEKMEDVFFLTTTVSDGKSNLSVKCPLVGWDKTLGGKNNPTQNLGAAITYVRRYNLLNLFNLAAVDDDAECLTAKEEPKAAKIHTNPGEYVYPVGAQKGKTVAEARFDYAASTVDTIEGLIHNLEANGSPVPPEYTSTLIHAKMFIEQTLDKNQEKHHGKTSKQASEAKTSSPGKTKG